MKFLHRFCGVTKTFTTIYTFYSMFTYLYFINFYCTMGLVTIVHTFYTSFLAGKNLNSQLKRLNKILL